MGLNRFYFEQGSSDTLKTKDFEFNKLKKIRSYVFCGFHNTTVNAAAVSEEIRDLLFLNIFSWQIYSLHYITREICGCSFSLVYWEITAEK